MMLKYWLIQTQCWYMDHKPKIEMSVRMTGSPNSAYILKEFEQFSLWSIELYGVFLRLSYIHLN